jgi:acyl-CoA dehydrogenase
MELALPQVIHAEPLERKLLKALKHGEIKGITWDEQVRDAIAKQVLSKDEADILVRVRELVAEIIAVDDFDVEELRLGRRAKSRLDTQHAA